MIPVILLVEDNPTDQKLAVRAFRHCSVEHRMVVANDGAEAVALLADDGPEAPLPALVLLDLKLPRVDGLEVIRRLRADVRTRHVPVVVLTASREAEDVVGSYALGANAYVRKPVDHAEFVAAAETIAVFWLRLNEAPPLR